MVWLTEPRIGFTVKALGYKYKKHFKYYSNRYPVFEGIDVDCTEDEAKLIVAEYHSRKEKKGGKISFDEDVIAKAISRINFEAKLMRDKQDEYRKLCFISPGDKGYIAPDKNGNYPDDQNHDEDRNTTGYWDEEGYYHFPRNPNNIGHPLDHQELHHYKHLKNELYSLKDEALKYVDYKVVGFHKFPDCNRLLVEFCAFQFHTSFSIPDNCGYLGEINDSFVAVKKVKMSLIRAKKILNAFIENKSNSKAA